MRTYRNVKEDNRLRIIGVGFLAIAVVIVVRLFILQVIRHEEYAFYALDSHEMYRKLNPTRGQIFFQDTRSHEQYPVAINKEYYTVYAVPKELAPGSIKTTTEQLTTVLGYTTNEDKQKEMLDRLSKAESSYQVIDKKVEADKVEQLKGLSLKGIYFSPQQYRFYPEGNLGASVLGFVAKDDQDNNVGKYGIEGYLNKELSGNPGYLAGEKSALGSWISLAGRKVIPAEDGDDLVLTIDRRLQYYACQRLQEGLVEYKAKSASLVMMNPQTGAIVAMCSLPDFDPNNYSKVKSLEQFNNTAIFTAYEPGSVFKPFTMSAALDLGLVNPQTTFAADPCKFDVGKGLQPIRNAENKCYPGTLTMTNILEHSINTGMTWVVGKIGLEKFREYVQKYGFGEKTGIPLSTEVAGTMAGLNLKINMYYSSFGQGLATTPLQLAVAYSAMANDGAMPKPYIIDEIHHPNGTIEKTQPKILEQVISTPAAKRITGMLVSVVENTYTKSVRIPEYYIAAKTGTAQVPQKGGYKSSAYNHTLAGYGPATNAKVVLIVKYEEPDRRYAESTAAPIFKDVMKFALDYYNVPSER